MPQGSGHASMANCGRDCQSQAEPESMLGAALMLARRSAPTLT